MQENLAQVSREFIDSLCGEFLKNNHIDPADYENVDVKRGLKKTILIRRFMKNSA